MKSQTKRYLNITFSLIFVIFFIYVLSKLDFQKFIELGKTISYSVWILVFLTFVALYFFKSLRVVLLNRDLSLWDSIIVSTYHNFFLMLLPFKLGELAYIKKLNDYNIKIRKSVSDLVVLRVYDSILILFLAIFVAFNSSLFVNFYVKIGIFVTFLVLILFLVRTSLFFSFVNFIPGWDFFHIGKIKKESSHVLRIIHGLSPKLKITLFLVTALIWIFSFASWVILLSQLTSLTLVSSLFASLVVLVTSMLPINPPAGLGITQGGWILGLALVGASYDFSLHFSVLANMVYVLSIAIIFLIVYLFNHFIQSRKLQNNRLH